MAKAKSEKCKKTYITNTGERGKSWTIDAVSLEFKFAGGGTYVRSPSDYPEVLKGLAFFGISEKLGNSYAGADTAGEAEESFLSMDEQLKAGDWLAEREAGERPSMVADAVIAAKRAAGHTFDEEATRAKYTGKGSAENRKTALANKAVRAEFDRLVAENAAKKAAESA